MAPRAGRAETHEEEQLECPLCINELDETEKAWLPCSCGYQLCLFCYDRLKTEFGNKCPNCRVEYDCDFQAGLRRRQERVAQLQREAAQREAASKAAALAVIEQRQGSKHVQPPPPPPPPRAMRSPRSPRRDLHIEQEQLWPSLGAAAAAAAQPQHHHRGGSEQRQQHQPQLHRQQQQRAVEAGARRVASPPRLAPILPQPLLAAEQEVSSSSSADTAATTPQSPVSSVVAFRAVPVLGDSAAAAAAAVQGRCAVVLQRSGGGLGVDADPEGASLAASLQEAVRVGSLSVKQAAASLASYLRQRQRQQQQVAAALAAASSAGSSPTRGCQQPSSAGSTGVGPSPFAVAGAACACSNGLLSSEPSLAPCDSAATTVTLSHWVPGLSSPVASLPLHSPLWQQQAPAPVVGSPMRDNDKLPLFMRRGSLSAAAAAAATAAAAVAQHAQSNGVGSPSSAASSGSSAASLPGFPCPSSPTQDLKRIIAPPPGFGPPLGSNSIAALPRFR